MDELINITDYRVERNFGYSEGYKDGLKNKIEKLSFHPTEAVVLFVSTENITVQEASSLVEVLEENFPNNKVVVLPDDVSLHTCGKDELENIFSKMSKIIENL